MVSYQDLHPVHRAGLRLLSKVFIAKMLHLSVIIIIKGARLYKINYLTGKLNLGYLIYVSCVQ